MYLKALVVEDEPFARADLRGLIANAEGISVAWEAGSLAEARCLLASVQPDVVFLDIQLTDGSGFDLMPDLAEATEVVFVTAYDQYALRAFDVNALDYLLKPVSMDRFSACLARLRNRQGAKPPKAPSSQVDLNDRILIKSGARREFIAPGEMVAVVSMGGNYTQVCRIGGAWFDVRRTLKDWETILPREAFVRVHRATMVNLQHIERVARHPSGNLHLQVKHIQDPIIVSRRHAQRFEEAFVGASARMC
jgi:two-component system LytT family response regulator